MQHPNLKSATLAYIVAAMLLGAPLAVSAADWYAAPDGTEDAACTEDDPGTIQAGIDKAKNTANKWENGDTVILARGVYDLTSNTNASAIDCRRKYLTIRSGDGDRDGTIILGRGTNLIDVEDEGGGMTPTLVSTRAFYASQPTRLQGLTITNFYSAAGGAALYGQAAAYLDNCIVACNASDASTQGGAVYKAGVTGCLFLGNTNPGGNGGAIMGNTGYNRGNIATNCVFVGNSAGSGGATYLMNVYDCVFSNNYASGNGGAVTLSYLSDKVGSCLFIGNSCGGNHAGVRGATVTNCTFIGNTAQGSGGACGGSYPERHSLTDCTFIGNVAVSGSGGAVSSAGYATNCVYWVCS